MKISGFFLVAGLLLAACGNRTASPPDETAEDLCLTGVEFTPGETIDLGEGAEFAAELKTWGGVDPSATLVVTLPDASFPPAASTLPREGEVGTINWGNRVGVTIANCGGRYYYRSFFNEVEMPERDSCGAGFGGPLKPWPFQDRVLLFRPPDQQEVWLMSGSGRPALVVYDAAGRLVEAVEVERPANDKTSLVVVPVEPGILEVTIKNCGEVYYYRAAWRSE